MSVKGDGNKFASLIAKRLVLQVRVFSDQNRITDTLLSLKKSAQRVIESGAVIAQAIQFAIQVLFLSSFSHIRMPICI